jgi:hypothetical protein
MARGFKEPGRDLEVDMKGRKKKSIRLAKRTAKALNGNPGQDDIGRLVSEFQLHCEEICSGAENMVAQNRLLFKNSGNKSQPNEATTPVTKGQP